MSKKYYIIRVSDGAYWRPESKGYTDLVSEAGLFDQDYAYQITRDSEGKHKMATFEEGGYISYSNLAFALSLAINNLRADELKSGLYFQSNMRAGLESNLQFLEKHKFLEIKP